jgi:hypothetical protein
MDITNEWFGQQRRPRFGKHRADLGKNGVIRIWGGEVIRMEVDKHRHRRSLDDYALDTRSSTWVRTTNRNWRQFSIRPEGRGLFVLERRPKPENLLPLTIDYVCANCQEWNGARIIVDGVPVSLTVDVSFIDLIIEGNLPPETSQRLAEEIRRNAEAFVGSPCIFE